MFLGAFDENDGNSRIVVRIGGVEVADLLLDENPGSGAPDASTAVRREVALSLAVATGDEIEITVFRDGDEYARLDYLELVPTGNGQVFQGTNGDDVIVGGLGDDTLTGLSGDDRFVVSAGDDIATDFTLGEDDISLYGLLSDVAPGDIDDFVQLTSNGPDALFLFDEDGAGDFSVTGREGTLTLTDVDLTGKDLSDLLDDGTLWLG